MTMGTLATITETEARTASPDVQPSSGRKGSDRFWLDAAVLSGITLIAAFLRLHSIGAREFWFDETLSVAVAKMPWRQFFLTLWYREANMALYFLCLRFWLALGTAPGMIRALSAVFSIATVPLIYALGARFFGRTTGQVAAWVLAINAFHIRYAQEARGYTLVVFFGTLATWLLVRNLEEPASAHWTAYAIVCAAAVYSHLFGLLVVLVHVLALAFPRRQVTPWRDIARSLTGFACSLLPMAIFALRSKTDTVDWIAPTDPLKIVDFWRDLVGSPGNILVALEAIVVAIAGYCAWRALRGADRATNGWTYALLFAWLFVPPAATIAASWVHPIFLPRYLIICLPALTLLVASSITRLRAKAIAALVCGAISFFSILGTMSYYHHDFGWVTDGWDAATSYVLDRAQPGDGVFFYMSTAHVPFEYYRSQRHPPAVWPQPLELATGLALTPNDFKFIPIGERLRDSRSAGDRVWLVLQYDTDPSGLPDRGSTFIRSYFGKGRHPVMMKKFVGATVLLLARDTVENAEVRATGP